MKKIYLILFLLVVNFCLLYAKISSNKLKNIDLDLKDNQIAIIVLSLEKSKSFLIKMRDQFLLYVFSYEDDSELEINLSLFTEQPDYVFTREEYSLKYPYKMQVDGLVVIQDIQLESNKVHYNDFHFCINEIEQCDFIYLTEEIELPDNIGTIFYDEQLSSTYIESLHEKWTDVYKVTDDSYTILLLDQDYEVIHLDH